MSKVPDDLGQKPKAGTETSSSPESDRPAQPTEKPATPQDVLTKLIFENPKLRESKESGTGFVLAEMEPLETVRARFMRELSQNRRWSEAKPSGQGVVIVGARPSSGKPATFDILLTTLRQGEPALGNLSLTDRNWLTTALAHLIQIDESRRAENAHGSPYCIFEAGSAYFQCRAPSFGTYLRCESVSEKFVPEIRAIITPEKRERLVREFGFTAPGYSKNFSQKIEIEGQGDLAYVARMAFRVLRDIYQVTDFGSVKVKISIPERANAVPI